MTFDNYNDCLFGKFTEAESTISTMSLEKKHALKLQETRKTHYVILLTKGYT